MEKQKTLHEELKRYFGFDTFKGNQKAIIESVLSEKDTFVLMLPVGENRSVTSYGTAFQGHCDHHFALIALMKNQVDAMQFQ